MAENNPNIEQFIVSSLNSDSNISLNDISGFYLKNGDITDYTNKENNTFIQNLNSNKLCVTIPDGYEICGHRKIDDAYHILCLGGEIGSGIYLLNEDNCTLNALVSGNCLNFHPDYWVDIRFKRRGNGRYIYFTDNRNPIRYLNIDDCKPKVRTSSCRDCNEEYSQELDCDALKIFQNVSFPGINLDRIEGNIPAGVYQIGITYSDETTPIGEYFIYSEVINFHGIHSNRDDRFGIKISFKDCFDGLQDYYQIVLISHREDRQTSVQIVGTYPTSQQEFYITELDSPRYIPISLEELLNVGRYYQTAEYIATNNEMLILGNAKVRNYFNYQTQANQITSKWVLLKVKAENAHKFKSYQRNEVYPHTIEWIYRDGETTPKTHIPSNVEAQEGWFDILSDEAVGDDVWTDPCNEEQLQHWQVYNTATVTSLFETGDNGYTGSEECYNELCVRHTLTGNPYLKVRVEYVDCCGNDALYVGAAKDFDVCAIESSVDVTVTDEFIPSDLINTSVDGSDCAPGGTSFDGSTCYLFKLSPKFNNVGMTVQWSSCINDEFGQTCDLAYDSMGGLGQDIEFCTCTIGEEPIEEVTVTFDEVTLVIGDPCGTAPVGEIPESACEYTVVAEGNFAYWESSIKYPNNENFENLPYLGEGGPCDAGIRYHKFPDCSLTWTDPEDEERVFNVTHIHNNTFNCKSQEYVYVLGVVFSNITYPVDCNGNPISDIVGYRISVGDRTGNKSILHNGLIHNMRYEENQDCEVVYYPNYPFNDNNPDILIGSKEFVRAELTEPAWGFAGNFVPLTGYSKTAFQYISPDVNLNITDNQGEELYIQAEENGYIQGKFSEEERFHDIVNLDTFSYMVAFTVMLAAVATGVVGGAVYQAIGVYEQIVNLISNLSNGVNYAIRNIQKSNYSRYNLVNVIVGNRRRKIDLSYFMQSTKQEVSNLKVNNYQRENAILLKLHADVNDTEVTERSRVKLGKRPLDEDFLNEPVKTLSDGVCSPVYSDCDQTAYKTASYYVSTVRRLPSQYGFLTDFVTRPISDVVETSDPLVIYETDVLLGGDVYITKHSYIKKFSFFNYFPLDGGFDNPFRLRQEANVGYPKYWMDYNGSNALLGLVTGNPITSTILSFTDIIGGTGLTFNTYHLDTVKSNFFKKNCNDDTEESCNTQPGGNPFLVPGKFYSHYIGVMNYYCESEFIGEYREFNDIPETQYYPVRDLDDIQKYRTILNPEQFLYNPQQLWKGVPSKQVPADPYLECCDKKFDDYSEIAFSLKEDNYSKTDKWLNFRPRNTHRFTLTDGLLRGMDEIDNYNLLFRFDNAAYVTQADDTLITKNNLQVYLGSGSIFENRMKKISSEINGLGGSIDRFSLTNTPYGVFWYDQIRKTPVWYDYKSLIPVTGKQQSWFNEFGDGTVRASYDSFSKNIFFSSDDWNMHIKPEARSEEGIPFISYHTWIPDLFLPSRYGLLSAKNDKIYKHNQPGSYQIFYDETHPFEIGFRVNNKFQTNVLQSIDVYSEWIESLGWGEDIYHLDKFFDKIFIYNNFVSSGMQDLHLRDPKNPQVAFLDVNRNNLVEVSPISHEMFRINGFRNLATGQPLVKWNPNGIDYTSINTTLKANDRDLGLMKGKFFKIHLINTKHTKYKILVQLSNITQDRLTI